ALGVFAELAELHLGILLALIRGDASVQAGFHWSPPFPEPFVAKLHRALQSREKKRSEAACTRCAAKPNHTPAPHEGRGCKQLDREFVAAQMALPALRRPRQQPRSRAFTKRGCTPAGPRRRFGLSGSRD